MNRSLMNIFFIWEGSISPDRLKILQDCVYSTRIFNTERPIYVVSNTLRQEQFDPLFNIQVIPWDSSFFEGLPVSSEIVEAYRTADPRTFSDFFRLVLLYQFGGSYIDTDDLCIRPITTVPNLICRSYDPHTSFYNKIVPEQCIPGIYRDGIDVRHYDHIPMFPRNDCWMNFTPKHELIRQMFTHPKFVQAPKHPISILGDMSFQALSLYTCMDNLSRLGELYNFGLSLMYVFEDFVAGCSEWDRGDHGGEMIDIWKSLPRVQEYPWGQYKCNARDALAFMARVTGKYPSLSHLWLHTKEAEPEWKLDIRLNTQKEEQYYVSTWIYTMIRHCIEEDKQNIRDGIARKRLGVVV